MQMPLLNGYSSEHLHMFIEQEGKPLMLLISDACVDSIEIQLAFLCSRIKQNNELE